MSTLKDFKNKYVGLMSESGIENAAFDFDYVVQEEGNITRFDLLANPDMEIYSETEKKLSEIFLRYIKGEPLQYILGYTYFMNGKFKVAPGILIPRSDTEVVVEQALEYIKNHVNASVLDLCCGSGCIGLSIAEACPSVNVCLCDISPIAIEITTENFYDYFRDDEYYTIEKNNFGDVEHIKLVKRFILKEEFETSFDPEKSNLDVEVAISYTDIDVDASADSLEILSFNDSNFKKDYHTLYISKVFFLYKIAFLNESVKKYYKSLSIIINCNKNS